MTLFMVQTILQTISEYKSKQWHNYTDASYSAMHIIPTCIADKNFLLLEECIVRHTSNLFNWLVLTFNSFTFNSWLLIVQSIQQVQSTQPGLEWVWWKKEVFCNLQNLWLTIGLGLKI